VDLGLGGLLGRGRIRIHDRLLLDSTSTLVIRFRAHRERRV